jgi:hypothetical protein
MTLSITMLYQYAECHFSECHVLFIVMINVFMPSVIMLYHYAECQCAGCYYAERRGAILNLYHRDLYHVGKSSYDLLWAPQHVAL